MTLKNLDKAPFPWFGGKSKASAAVWAALGDVAHYVEPFFGSGAVLLGRPHECNRAYYSETVNDLDGLLVNFWRSIQMSPDATADAASWPVSEADLHARHLALIRWRAEMQLEHLMGDPAWHDPAMAGWWAWGLCCWIGSGWCSGDGCWIVGPDGRLVKRASREPGVARQLPHVSDNGMGVNRPGTREPGVARQLPHVSDNGMGVNHAGARLPGTDHDCEYHPVTMPELRRWFSYLSARLRHVRILNGDWHRACTNGVVKSLSVRKGGSYAGIFLDPPYSSGADRAMGLYACDSGGVGREVAEFAAGMGDRLDHCRVVVAGFDGEYGTLLTDAGYTEVEWFEGGFLRGGMGNQRKNGGQQRRERLWLSPGCLGAIASPDRQVLLGL